MNTLLADPPAPAAPAEPTPEPALAPERRCAECGASMNPAQDWCLECGEGAPDRLPGPPTWRSATAIIAAVVVLVLAAGAASVAALTSPGRRTVHAPAAVAQTPPVTPAPVNPGGTLPATPPKIPGAAVTPPPAKVTPAAPVQPATPVPATHTTAPVAPAPAPAAQPVTPAKPSHPSPPAPGTPGGPILLDTDSASTYNPSGYPDSRFGDASLATDQDSTTAWTAQVEPSTAPKLALGLLIDLKAPQKLGSLNLVTNSPGMVVEIYGARGATAPPTITDPGWTRLGSARAVQRTEQFTLATAGRSFHFVVLWITKAPSASPTASVAVNEVTLKH